MIDSAAPQPDSLDEAALRRRLINRIVLAGVAIAGLLGGLALIDSLYVAPPKATSKKPKPVVIVENSQPATMPSLSTVNAVPVQIEALPEPPKPEAVPVAKKSATPSEYSTVHPKSTATAHKANVNDDDVTGPTTPPIPAPSPPLSQPPARSAKPARQFVLQMGVFNNVDNAQELMTKLQKGGVPAQIEARVQVGPFKNKAEADLARKKLDAMGLDAGLLMAIHKSSH